MNPYNAASQTWSMQVQSGSYPSSVNGDEQRPDLDVDRVMSHTAIREELTSDYVRGIQDEMRKKESHRKKSKQTLSAYTHSAKQKVEEAIGSHTELIPLSGLLVARQYPAMFPADEDYGAPESTQQGDSAASPERWDSARPADNGRKRSSSSRDDRKYAS